MGFRSRKIISEASVCGKPAVGKDKEFMPCNTQSCTKDKDCQLSLWSEWSDCSCTEDGVKRRSRRIISYGTGKGAWCEGGTKEITGCNVRKPDVKKPVIDCALSDWTAWSVCSKSCANGQAERKRSEAVAAVNGGLPCVGKLQEMTVCNLGECPIKAGPKPCLWGNWMGWGACDKCGGERKRTRQILRMPEEGGTPCPDGASEEVTKCPRKCHDPVFCVWTQWEDEGSCSATCGEGTIKRVRYLQATKDEPEHVISGMDLVNEDDMMSSFTQRKIIESDSRTRELILSFASGGLVSFVGVMIVMIALRSRQQSINYSGVEDRQ